MAARLVTIKGTWSRSNTSRSEVNWTRRRLRRIGVEFTLPRDQKDELDDAGRRRYGTKSGTFTAVVALQNNSGWLVRAKMGKVALHVLEAKLERELCRIPKLKIDAEATKVTTAYDVEPDLP